VQLHAIGILTSTWGGQVFFEAMRFWFYALSCAVLSLSYQLLLLRDDEKKDAKSGVSTDGKSEDDKKGDTVPAKVTDQKVETPRSVLFWRLVGASCDLLIPGTFVGWFDVSPAVVAGTSILSSVLSSIEIWQRVNQK